MIALKSTLDRCCLWILATLAPEDTRDAVLGDAIELATDDRMSLWSNTVASALPLAALKFTALRWRDGLTVAGFVFAVTLWEFTVARQYSWPIAKQVLPYSPLSTAATCMAMYVMLYGVFALATGALIRIAKRAHWMPKLATQLLMLAALAPPVLLLMFPTPVDSVAFRFAQFAAILMGLFAGRERSRHRGSVATIA
ncbi:MAG: hypothetical protein AAFN07_14165 [Pseudomonadota bacterium]